MSTGIAAKNTRVQRPAGAVPGGNDAKPMTAAEKKAAAAKLAAEKKAQAKAEAAFIKTVTAAAPPPTKKPPAAKVKEMLAKAEKAKTRANPRDMAEFIDPETGQLFRRTSDVTGNPYELPKKYQRHGWDYEWWAVRVNGEPVDPSIAVMIREGGWRPVPAKDMPDLIPPGWDKPYIERGAQVLYQRPMYLTQESRAQDIKRAEDQRYDKLKSALAGPQELGKISKRVTTDLEVYGSVGVADKAA